MRGRTNISGGGGLEINGQLKEYEVKSGQTIEAGNFVQLEESKASNKLTAYWGMLSKVFDMGNGNFVVFVGSRVSSNYKAFVEYSSFVVFKYANGDLTVVKERKSVYDSKIKYTDVQQISDGTYVMIGKQVTASSSQNFQDTGLNFFFSNLVLCGVKVDSAGNSTVTKVTMPYTGKHSNVVDDSANGGVYCAVAIPNGNMKYRLFVVEKDSNTFMNRVCLVLIDFTITNATTMAYTINKTTTIPALQLSSYSGTVRGEYGITNILEYGGKLIFCVTKRDSYNNNNTDVKEYGYIVSYDIAGNSLTKMYEGDGIKQIFLQGNNLVFVELQNSLYTYFNVFFLDTYFTSSTRKNSRARIQGIAGMCAGDYNNKLIVSGEKSAMYVSFFEATPGNIQLEPSNITAITSNYIGKIKNVSDGFLAPTASSFDSTYNNVYIFKLANNNLQGGVDTDKIYVKNRENVINGVANGSGSAGATIPVWVPK